MAEPPFLDLEEPKAEVCFRRAGPSGVFSEFGVSGRKMCRGVPKTSQSGASAGKSHIDAPKGSEMNMKMTETGHMGRKHSLMPRRMI